VARALVMREWPDRVRIVVTEEQPAWLWGDDGLLNARAELFVTGETDRPTNLPRLDGPPGSEALLAARYLEYDAALSGCAMRVAAHARGRHRVAARPRRGHGTRAQILRRGARRARVPAR